MLFTPSRFTATVTGLLLISGLGFSSPVLAQNLPAASPVSAKKIPMDHNAFLIVPRQSVGKITQQTNRQQLAAIFGKNNVEDFTDHGPEGEGDFPATHVKIGGKRSLDIQWQDETRKKITNIAIYDSRWHLADGLSVNTSVAALHQKFGKFSFYGFGWDYSGTVISENNVKLDQYRKQFNINFTLGVPRDRCQRFQADCLAVSGDATFESDNPHLVPLQPRIEVLYVRF